MPDLWSSTGAAAWRTALDRYDDVVAAQGVARLAELDRWYHDELPARVRGRSAPHATLDELARLTEWKMARGVWRAESRACARQRGRGGGGGHA